MAHHSMLCHRKPQLAKCTSTAQEIMAKAHLCPLQEKTAMPPSTTVRHEAASTYSMQTCKYSTHYPSANQPVRPTRLMVGVTNSAPDKLCNSGPSQSATTTTVHQAHNTHNSSAQHYGTPASGDIAEQRTENTGHRVLGRPKRDVVGTNLPTRYQQPCVAAPHTANTTQSTTIADGK